VSAPIGEGASPGAPESRPLRRIVLLWIVPAIAVLAGLLVWALGGREVETDNAYLKADLVTLYPEIDAQVTEVLVEENQVVTAGQALVRLDRAAAAIDVARAEAHLSSIRGELDALRRQYEQRRSERRLAEEQLAYAQKESGRQRELVDRKLAPAMRLDAAEHDALQAQGRLGVVDDGIAELRVRLGAALTGDAPAHPRVREAAAELDAARLRLEHAELRAPSAGRVVKVPERGAMARRGARTSAERQHRTAIRVLQVRRPIEGQQAGARAVELDARHRRVVHRPGELDRFPRRESEERADGRADHAGRGADIDAPRAALTRHQVAQALGHAAAEPLPRLDARRLQGAIRPKDADLLEPPLEGARVDRGVAAGFRQRDARPHRVGPDERSGAVFVEGGQGGEGLFVTAREDAGGVLLALQRAAVDRVRRVRERAQMVAQQLHLTHAERGEAVVVVGAEGRLSVAYEVEGAHRMPIVRRV
jgi:multidrug efflux pump subunit AcrA (membrane-fusion protein)